MGGTHESFVRWQGGSDVGEKERDDQAPLHCDGDRRGEECVVEWPLPLFLLSAPVPARVRNMGHP